MNETTQAFLLGLLVGFCAFPVCFAGVLVWMNRQEIIERINQ